MQLLADVWRLNKWTQKFENFLFHFPLTQILVQGKHTGLSQALLLREHHVGASSLRDHKLDMQVFFQIRSHRAPFHRADIIASLNLTQVKATVDHLLNPFILGNAN